MIGLWLLLAILLIETNPNKSPMIMLVAPFIILFIALFTSLRCSLEYLWPGLARHKRLIFAAYLSGLPCVLLVLSSINQLTWRDATLLILIVLALLLYSSRIHLTN